RIQNIIDKCKESNKNVYYGYPVFIDHKGNISPIFFSKITVKEEGEQVAFIREENEVEFNHYVLLANGFEHEEITLIKDEIEQEIDVSKNIKKILDMLNHRRDETLPPGNEIQTRVIDKVIIYFDERSHITHSLILELQKLKKLPFQQIKASGLRSILSKETKKDDKDDTYTGNILEIYPCNFSQEQAIRKALKKPLTVITGPPGTGKSQVVLNIIANAVYQNKTILFASRNNKAVDVVIERLNNLLPYHLIIRMGAQEYRREARNKIESTIKDILLESTKKEHLNIDDKMKSDFEDVNQAIKKLYDKLEDMNKINSTIDQYQNNIDTLIEEIPLDFYTRFKNKHFNIDHKTLTHQLKITLKKDQHNPTNLINRLFNRYPTRTQDKHNQRLHSMLPSEIQEYIKEQKIHDYKSIAKSLNNIKEIELLKEKIKAKKNKLLLYPSFNEIQKDIDKIREKRVKLSKNIIIQHWLKKIYDNQESIIKNTKDYISASEKLEGYINNQKEWREAYNIQSKTIKRLLKAFPVWVVTNLSVKNSLPLKNNLFDILIIDEASQCDIPSALPLLYRAKKVVIIGDPNQLKHISLIKKTKDKNLASQSNIYGLYNDFSYNNNSCYSCAENIIIKKHDKPILLNRHYRCHSDIIEFSNQYFYDNHLEIHTNPESLIKNNEIKQGIKWIDIQGETTPAKSPYNEEEIKKTIEVLSELSKNNHSDISYGVVTLFRAQMEKITEEINRHETLKNMNITVGTAHKFQGDEKDIIIFSLALSKGVKKTTLNWVHTTSQLLNVAITRAKTSLIIIGDKKTCYQAKGLLPELVRYTNLKQYSNKKTSASQSQIKEEIYKRCIEQGCMLKTNHPIKIYYNNMVKYLTLDFILPRNNKRYYISIEESGSMDDYKENERRLKHRLLRENGWSIREYNVDDPSQIEDIVNEIERYC
ncbi:MAG: DEAD/DEAH box helicase, partial [Candidatus Thermoplasmatota archaeon]